MTDDTHDPVLHSWVRSANTPGTDFPIQNLPFGIFRRAGRDEAFRAGVAIGDQVLDLAACADAKALDRSAAVDACREPALNALMAMGRPAARELRRQISALLAGRSEMRPRDPSTAASWLVPQAEVELALPTRIGDYTDFYASIHHATNVGRLFRPDKPLLPNYRWIPIGYHGRASSIVVSGTPIVRPEGQRKSPSESSPSFGPSQRLDYEAELGLLVGRGNALGVPVPMAEASAHLFGCCLVNDWSARDIQSWEYQPLGPFLGKSFATTQSPWVVTMDALEPYRVPVARRAAGDPAPLPYLMDADDEARGGLSIIVDVQILTPGMRKAGQAPARLSRSSAADLYWTVAQMLTHHTSNGCNLRPGDLLASGTVSGPGDGAQGCLLEITRNGAAPLTLPGGESRAFLQDGDEVLMTARGEREGWVGIGFGLCRGRVGA
ncbi:MAG TPA: fumarylacetoacetase [Vicinamibacterales bacterium]|jgi:fumarylacetoacetase